MEFIMKFWLFFSIKNLAKSRPWCPVTIYYCLNSSFSPVYLFSVFGVWISLNVYIRIGLCSTTVWGWLSSKISFCALAISSSCCMIVLFNWSSNSVTYLRNTFFFLIIFSICASLILFPTTNSLIVCYKLLFPVLYELSSTSKWFENS